MRDPGHADLVGPHIGRLVVVGIDGDPQPVTVHAEDLGQQLPGQSDGLGLEVIAEAEVAEHLEERDVLGRAPYLLDVVVLAPHPHTFLDAGGPPVGGISSPRKYGMNWFIPALVNRGALGWWGTSPAEAPRCARAGQKNPQGAPKPVRVHYKQLTARAGAASTALQEPGPGQDFAVLAHDEGLAQPASRLGGAGRPRPFAPRQPKAAQRDGAALVDDDLAAQGAVPVRSLDVHEQPRWVAGVHHELAHGGGALLESH